MKKALKITAYTLGSLIGLFVLAAVIVPLVVDVDKYRPQIIQVVNDNINGKVDIGKLSLSLWGQIKVRVEGVWVNDAKNRSVLSVKDAYFHLPFSSIFSGAPTLTFKMANPQVLVVKDADGKLNVLSLVKAAQGAAAAAAAAPSMAGTPSQPKVVQAVTSAPQAKIALPAIVMRAKVGVEMRNAQLGYKDAKAGIDTQVKDLNFVLKNVSLSKPTELEIWADLDTKVGADASKAITVRGPVRMTGKAKPEFTGDTLDMLLIQSLVDLDKLEIRMPGLFEKKSGIPMNAEGLLYVNMNEIQIKKFDAKFFNAELKINGTVSQLSAGVQAMPVVSVSVRSNDIRIQPWSELVPMLKEFGVDGTTSLDAGIQGPADRLTYRVNVAFKGFTASHPMLKAPPRIDGALNVITDKVENLAFTLKAPGNELRFQSKVISFKTPKVEMSVTSPGMDLDQWINLPPLGKTKAVAVAAPADASGAPAAAAQKSTAATAVPSADFDALLDPVRTNPMIGGIAANLDVNIKLFKVYGVKITDIAGKMSFKDYIAAIDHFGLKLWGGTAKMTAATQLKPKTPTYRFDSEVNGLELQQAVESQLALLKNTLLGRVSFKAAGGGSSFNPVPAMKNLAVKGSMKVEKAKFATVDIMKATADGVNKSLDKIGEKVPQLKGKSLNSGSGRESRYDLIASDFSIADGKFVAPNFVAKAEPKQGIDLKGAVEVGMIDYSLKTSWEVSDTYNLTKACDLSAPLGSVDVPHVLCEGNAPFRFPLHAGGTCFAPTYSYTEVPEYLTKIALGNVANALGGKAKSEAQKKAQEAAAAAIQKAAPAVQNAVQDLGKKLKLPFGR